MAHCFRLTQLVPKLRLNIVFSFLLKVIFNKHCPSLQDSVYVIPEAKRWNSKRRDGKRKHQWLRHFCHINAKCSFTFNQRTIKGREILDIYLKKAAQHIFFLQQFTNEIFSFNEFWKQLPNWITLSKLLPECKTVLRFFSPNEGVDV